MGRESISFILALEGDGSILRTPKLSSSILVLEDDFSPPVMVPPILLAKGRKVACGHLPLIPALSGRSGALSFLVLNFRFYSFVSIPLLKDPEHPFSYRTLFVWKHTWSAAQFGNDLNYRRSTAVSNSSPSPCNEPTIYWVGLDAYCLWHFKYHYIEVYTRKSKFKTGILAVTAGPFVYVMGRKGRLLKSMCLASGFCLGGGRRTPLTSDCQATPNSTS